MEIKAGMTRRDVAQQRGAMPVRRASRQDVAPAREEPIPPEIQAAADARHDYAAGLLLWRYRRENPDMALTIDAEEIAAFNASLEYMKQQPSLRVKAMPRFLIVAVVDSKTGDPIKPIESNERDFDRTAAADAKRRIREQASNLVNTARSEMASGTFSDDTMTALCNTVLALAGR